MYRLLIFIVLIVTIEIVILYYLWIAYKPYRVVKRAYKRPYQYVSKNPGTYRGMYSMRGRNWMVNNYLTKNSWGVYDG